MKIRAPHITYFAKTNVRQPYRTFGIKDADRLSHIYVIGKTGTGKSTLLETLIRQDLERGRGFALVDPHGDLAERIHAAANSSVRKDVMYVDVRDPEQPYGYNPLRYVRQDRRPLAASGMLEVMKKMWPDAWGVRMEHILRYALLALLDYPAAQLSDILTLLTDRSFRHANGGLCSIALPQQIRPFVNAEACCDFLLIKPQLQPPFLQVVSERQEFSRHLRWF